VKVGSTIFIADGSLVCQVKELKEKSIVVKVMNDATIGERKNMNLPGTHVDLPILLEKDENDIRVFGPKHQIDMVAASFVQSAENVDTIRKVLETSGQGHVKIIAKIENQSGLNNFDEILEKIDGIMVARGDLGMEIPPEKVFIAQKWMIEKCNAAAKPVQTATQMLESMIKNPRPTRAEASDVANAVLDGSDCVMLSGESANGCYPVAAVTVMARTCCEAERCIDYRQAYNDMKLQTPNPSTAEAVASSAVGSVLDLNLNCLIVLTDTGLAARLTAKYKPSVPILACSKHAHVIHNLNSTRGVFGRKIADYKAQEEAVKQAIAAAKEMDLVKAGGKAAVILASNEETPDEATIMKIVNIE
jgi:pyruvate kinase